MGLLVLIVIGVLNLFAALALHSDFEWLNWLVVGLATGAAIVLATIKIMHMGRR